MTVETGIDGMYACMNDTNHKKPQTKLADANYSELGGVSIASHLALETVLLICFLLYKLSYCAVRVYTILNWHHHIFINCCCTQLIFIF